MTLLTETILNEGSIILTKERMIMLTADRVMQLIKECASETVDETDDNNIIIEGIINKVSIRKDKLKEHEEEIFGMLLELPEEFLKSKGGGMTFLMMCNDKDGKMWTGLHPVMEALVVLGIGINKVSYCLPKEMWVALPGRMPYLVVNDEKE